MKNKSKYKSGFTLVELIGASSVIIVLLALAIPAVNNSLVRGEKIVNKYNSLQPKPVELSKPVHYAPGHVLTSQEKFQELQNLRSDLNKEIDARQ